MYNICIDSVFKKYILVKYIKVIMNNILLKYKLDSHL